MINKKEYPLEKIKSLVEKEKENIKEIKRYAEEIEKSKYASEERGIIEKRLQILEQNFKKDHNEILVILQKLDKPEDKVITKKTNYF